MEQKNGYFRLRWEEQMAVCQIFAPKDDGVPVSYKELASFLNNHGIEGYKEDLISNMKSLIKLSQGYTVCTRNNAPPLDEDDSKETKALWQSVFDIDAEDDYITAYVHEVKKLLLLLQLLVTIYEKIVSFNDKEANRSFQELFENSLSENLNLMHFAEFIDSKQVSRKDSEKIIDVCDKLLAEIQDL